MSKEASIQRREKNNETIILPGLPQIPHYNLKQSTAVLSLGGKERRFTFTCVLLPLYKEGLRHPLNCFYGKTFAQLPRQFRKHHSAAEETGEISHSRCGNRHLLHFEIMMNLGRERKLQIFLQPWGLILLRRTAVLSLIWRCPQPPPLWRPCHILALPRT